MSLLEDAGVLFGTKHSILSYNPQRYFLSPTLVVSTDKFGVGLLSGSSLACQVFDL